MEGALPKAMLKSSLVASAVFAAAWFRVPPTTAMIVRNFVSYGALITIFAMVLGLPLARLIERLKIGRWWSYFAFAAATGALLGAILSSHPSCAAPIPPKRRTRIVYRKPLRYNLFALDEIATGIRWRKSPHPMD
jgi:hypothetical protein